MTYSLGIDLGTTYSAAAVHRDGRARIVELGSRSASIPSVVYLRDDGALLAGEAAQRRANADPGRVAREFKRRLGDTTPILLAGAPYSVEALSARLLRTIVEHVTEREGGAPASIAVTHPANWGPYKIDLLQQAVRLADLGQAELATEPEAAVRHYADNERVEVGSVIAVYDLGGGTFDAALLRKTDTGFEPLGRPEGIERLGGIDFDAAVVGHVVRGLNGAVEALDQDDPAVLQALARLRQDCVDAKEALSSDTDVSIPVLLPNIQTEVRLTRAEFETMIRPSLLDSLDAMRRALASASLEPADVDTVVLVGGSSRIPLIAQLVSNEFGRPVAVDADPKHAIALGAALLAGERSPAPSTAPEDARAPEAAPAESPDIAPDVAPDVAPEVAPIAPAAPPVPLGSAPPAATPESATVPAVTPEKSPATHRAPESSGSRVPVLAGAGAAVLAALVAGLIVMRGAGGGGPEEAAATAVTAASTAPPTQGTVSATTAPLPTTAPTTIGRAAPSTAPSTTATTAAPPTTALATTAPTPCPTDVERSACIVEIGLDAEGGLVATYVTAGYQPELEPAGDHIHFYFDTVVGDDERNAGSAGTGGDWRLWDAPNPFAATGGEQGRTGYTLADAQLVGAQQLCSIVARPDHSVLPGTGNCIAIPGA